MYYTMHEMRNAKLISEVQHSRISALQLTGGSKHEDEANEREDEGCDHQQHSNNGSEERECETARRSLKDQDQGGERQMTTTCRRSTVLRRSNKQTAQNDEHDRETSQEP